MDCKNKCRQYWRDGQKNRCQHYSTCVSSTKTISEWEKEYKAR